MKFLNGRKSFLDSNSAENNTEMSSLIQLLEQSHRIRRQSADYSSSDGSDTASTILSILPLDRIGSIVGQIMATGLKDMMNPNVGKKIVNLLETQAPTLITTLFTNLVTNLRGPVRAPPSSSSNTSNSISAAGISNALKPLSNSSSSPLLNAIRNPKKK